MIPNLDRRQERHAAAALVVVTLAAILQTLPYAGSHAGFVSLVFAIVGLPLQLAMGYAVLGFQVVNPFCPRVLLRLFCAFFFYGGAVGVVLGFAIPVLWSSPELPGNSATPAAAGMMIAAYQLNMKYGRTPHWLWN